MSCQTKKRLLALLLAAMLPLVCACHQNPNQEQLYEKLFAHFEQFGFSCRLEALEEEREVPIYKASAWQKLMLDGEEVLLYFDESNRADYLSEPVDESIYGYTTRFGLRFVLVYPGENAQVLKALQSIENE